MTKTKFKYGKQLKGSTYRFCHHCHDYHPYSKTRCLEKFASKHQKKMPNNWKYRHVAQDNELYLETYDTITKLFLGEQKKEKKKEKKQQHTLSLPLQHQKLKKPKTNNLIECPICYNHKGKCQQLYCQHIICQDCYQNIIQTNGLGDKCPLCREDFFSNNTEDYLIISRNPRLSRHYPLLKTSHLQSLQ